MTFRKIVTGPRTQAPIKKTRLFHPKRQNETALLYTSAKGTCLRCICLLLFLKFPFQLGVLPLVNEAVTIITYPPGSFSHKGPFQGDLGQSVSSASSHKQSFEKLPLHANQGAGLGCNATITMNRNVNSLIQNLNLVHKQ